MHVLARTLLEEVTGVQDGAVWVPLRSARAVACGDVAPAVAGVVDVETWAPARARAKPSERATAPPCNFKNCSQKWCVYVLVSRVVVSQTLYTMAPCAQRAIRRR